MRQPSPLYSLSSMVFYAGLIAITCAALIIRVNVSVKHVFPEGDEGPWLRMAARAFTPQFLESTVVEHDLYSIRQLPHPEDNRSPLFPVLLHCGRMFTRDYFRAAQVVNLLLYALISCCLGIVVMRRFGAYVALAAMIFVGVSPIFIINTSHIYNDVTMAMGFCILLMVGHVVPLSPLRATLGGSAIGALFLIKTSSIFLIPPVMFWFIYHGNRKQYCNCIFFITAFTLCAFPWMLRNYREFGSPFYQFTGYILFTDSLKEVFGVNVSPMSAASYITSHGVLFTLVIRPLIGLWNLVLQLLTHDHYLTAVLFPFAILGLWNVRGKQKILLTVVLFSIPYVGLMAYTAYGFWVDRYIMYLNIFIFISAANGMQLLTRKVHSPVLRYGAIVLVTVLPLISVAYPVEYYLSPRGSEAAQDKSARDIIVKIVPLVPDSVTVLSSFLSGYSFLHTMRVLNVLEFAIPENLDVLINAYEVRYAVLEKGDSSTMELITRWAGKREVRCLVKNDRYAFYALPPLHVLKADTATTW